jgi:ADP-ribosyl-[dinitrogen reductase] hydrolase
MTAEHEPGSHQDHLAGILLGTAVGDAVGLPAEGLPPRRRQRLLPGPWRHRLLFGRGMVSDDTEHTLLVAQSLLSQPDNAAAFARSLAWRLRWWFVGLPAGVGMATARACLKLWLGFPPDRSGVYSAGNGPAMRSALLGGYFSDDQDALVAFVTASTRLSHTDPRALTGALAVSRLAALAVRLSPAGPPNIESAGRLLSELAPTDREWRDLVDKLLAAYSQEVSVVEFASSLGLERGVTGYVYHTVPVAVYAWLRHYGDFRASLQAAWDCGGDTDTVGAIAGALAGATVGADGIPQDWLAGIIDWPRSVGLLRDVASRLDRQKSEGVVLGPVRYCWPAVLPRNLLFLAAVLAHGLRRLAPPY